MESNKKTTTGKVLNIISIIIGILVLIVAISTITSAGKGYTSIFGNITYTVKTESMVGDKPDSFNRGDIIFIRELSEDDKQNLKVGDIITFTGIVMGEEATITHRIVDIKTKPGTDIIETFITLGDNAKDIYDESGVLINEAVAETVIIKEVIGKYTGKIPFIGHFSLFLAKPVGFLIIIVVPSLLLVAYCAYIVFKNYKGYSNDKKAEELEEYKQKLLKEFQAVQASNQKPDVLPVEKEDLQS